MAKQANINLDSPFATPRVASLVRIRFAQLAKLGNSELKARDCTGVLVEVEKNIVNLAAFVALVQMSEDFEIDKDYFVSFHQSTRN